MSDCCFKSKTVKIRKERACFGCCRKFDKNQEMNYRAGIFYGDFYSCYHCLTCHKIEEHVREHYDEGYMYGWVLDEINELEPNLFIGQRISPEMFLEKLKLEKK